MSVFGFDPGTYGALYADEYDAMHDPGTTSESVALIADIAGQGRILELAIGTGRMALPLAAQGLRIEGIDASPEMVARLRAKPGGREIPVTIGDFADVAVDGPFDHVFLVFNTLFILTTQADQIRCFCNVGKRLAPGGSFLVETFVPDLARYQNGAHVGVRHLDRARVSLDAVRHDPVAQTLLLQRIHIDAEGTRLAPLAMRYAWPAEIDLMARLAGLTLVERWGGWQREAFTADSRMHVSLYRKPAL